MHKIAILGAGGLLGRAVVQRCMQKQISYFAANRAEVDLTQKELLRRWLFARSPTHIINCSAYTHVDLAEQETEKAFLVNRDAVVSLALCAKELGSQVVHISTDYVFGFLQRPYIESDLCEPLNLYGKSKRAGEEQLLSLLPEACVVRTSWLFGKGGKNYLSTLIDRMRSQEKMDVVADQMSRPTYVHDLAAILLALIEQDASGLFHFANHGILSRFSLAQELFSLAKARGVTMACRSIAPLSSSQFASAAQRSPYSVLDTTKIEKLLGPIRPWSAAASDYLDEVCV